jgi:hypothetical protein
MNTFYTYIWYRKDGSPYYVGKGKDNRAFISDSHGVHRPKDDSRILVQYWTSEAEAHEMERVFIDMYGRKDLGTGCLRNLTDGGEGTSGLKRIDVAQRNQSASNRDRWKAIGTKAAVSGQLASVRQPARARTFRTSEGMALGGRAASHKRWHTTRGIINLACLLCKPTEETNG